MRKLIIFNMMTLDGFFEGPNHELDWHIVDAEFNEFAINQLNSVDILLFGRKTYELMAGYWPTELGVSDDPMVAEKMNSKPKIVFSKTLSSAGWNNTRVIKNSVEEEILKLKKERGEDLLILGSANLAAYLINLGLIDEYRVIINPVVLGKGTSLFSNIDKRMNLKLVKTMMFKSGCVGLFYSTEK